MALQIHQTKWTCLRGVAGIVVLEVGVAAADSQIYWVEADVRMTLQIHQAKWMCLQGVVAGIAVEVGVEADVV